MNIEHRTDGDDWNFAKPVHTMALLGKRPPAHEWHHQIEDDDVRAGLTEPIEPSKAIGRLADQIPLAGEQIR